MGEKQRGLNTSETESYSRWWFKGCLVPRSDREGLTALRSLKPLVVSLVGSQMASLIGMSGLFFTTLGEGDVNIEMISQGASEIIISCVIKGRDEALNLVHQSCLSEPVEEREIIFFNGDLKDIRIYIATAFDMNLRTGQFLGFT